MAASGTAIIWMRGKVMHFEILIEDASGKIVLDIILEKILGTHGQDHTYRTISYKGIGRLPRDLRKKADPKKRILLAQLPRLLQGYGKAHLDYPSAVIVVVDLDNRDCTSFKSELIAVLDSCNPKPITLFRIAVEEGEAWLLGDLKAVRTAYPQAKASVLNNYHQDSICGTWEKLADAIYQGGSQELKSLGWPNAGLAKCEWAKKIAPHLDVNNNCSKSFQVFRDGIRNLAGITTG